MLYIVATPIGNLKDISYRALEVLKSVDLIACEDTRHTKILLRHYDIHIPTTSFFQHNRLSKGEYLAGLLKEGKNIALVSDAGTPGVLDPGYNLINLAIQNNLEITFIPGATAFLGALVLSGKPSHEFYFAGFLPNRSGARRNKLEKLKGYGCTLVFYESCHRILPCLEDLGAVFGEKEVVLVRELTKKFEEILRASPAAMLEKFSKNIPRGEFVVVV
ncbi:MAG: 16S rRNA (cytidine(1402)-2'-O)-methyltransferase [Candidatus Omnitrophica bacterium]|jgi:16S rRNA (cytidine1402-2'-O)-methyltransferase|nr:16S rRNA (cytidine(1402)-2'-O)-methyltransferase [Candidatus Omnitrophota bacterium]